MTSGKELCRTLPVLQVCIVQVIHVVYDRHDDNCLTAHAEMTLPLANGISSKAARCQFIDQVISIFPVVPNIRTSCQSRMEKGEGEAQTTSTSCGAAEMSVSPERQLVPV